MLISGNFTSNLIKDYIKNNTVKNLETAQKIVMGRKFLIFCLGPFLWIGITLLSLDLSGYVDVFKMRLKSTCRE